MNIDWRVHSQVLTDKSFSMLNLAPEEWENLKCQIGISNSPAATSKGKKAVAVRSQIVTASAGNSPHSSQTVMSGCPVKLLTSQFVISVLAKPPIGFL